MPFNDIEALTSVIKEHHNDIAGLMIELFSGNMGFIPANKDFITTAKRLCEQYNIVFIADEVMTGFRVHASGGSHLYHIKPDLTMLGKVIGGGFPVGAVGGKAAIMNLLSPEGGVYHAGTFAGHPLCMQAGSIVLDIIKNKNTLNICEQYIHALCDELTLIFKQKGIPFCTDYRQAMFGFFFQEKYPQMFSDIEPSSKTHFEKFYHHLRKHGVLLPPAHLEALFVTSAHDDECLALTIKAAKDAF